MKQLKMAAIFLLLTLSICQADEYYLEPVRPTQKETHLGDIVAHVADKNYYKCGKYNDNKVTMGHEASHFISERIGFDKGPDVTGFYVLGNRAFYFPNPKIRLTNIKNMIPHNMKDDIFNTYLGRPYGDIQVVDKISLILMDEQAAYINGCYVAKEYQDDFQLKYEAINAYKLSRFSLYMLKEIEQADPHYSKYDELCSFFLFQIDRLDSVAPQKEELTQTPNMLEYLQVIREKNKKQKGE